MGSFPGPQVLHQHWAAAPAPAPSAWPAASRQQQPAVFLWSFSELQGKRGHVKLRLQHVHLCPGVFNPSADADELDEAGEMQNSC